MKLKFKPHRHLWVRVRARVGLAAIIAALILDGLLVAPAVGSDLVAGKVSASVPDEVVQRGQGDIESVRSL